jgi:hypothetical protein
MNKSACKKIYKRLVQRTFGICSKGDGIAFQENLRAEWDDRLQPTLQKESEVYFNGK